MPTGVIGSMRSRWNGCNSSTVDAELFFRNATPIACGPAFTGQANLEALLEIVAGGGRIEVVGQLVVLAAEALEPDALPVERDFEVVRHFEPANDVDRLPIQLRADDVLAVDREGVADQHAAARADRQAFDVIVLRQIAAHAKRLLRRRDLRIADGQAGDLPRRRQIALHQRRRHAEHVRDVVESVRFFVRAAEATRRRRRARANRGSRCHTPSG